MRLGHPLNDRHDLCAATATHLRDQLGSGSRKRDAHPATILADPTPSHEALAHQAVAHSGRG